MRRAWVVVSLVVTLFALSFLASGGAQAVTQKQYFANTVGWVRQAQYIAVSVFPAAKKRCRGGVDVGPVVENRNVAAYAWRDEKGKCHIRVNFQPGRYVSNTWPGFCTTIVHEYGHLAGWRDPVTKGEHSNNPNSFMYGAPYTTVASTAVAPGCGAGPAHAELLTPG